jgi:hypothetical protein
MTQLRVRKYAYVLELAPCGSALNNVATVLKGDGGRALCYGGEGYFVRWYPSVRHHLFDTCYILNICIIYCLIRSSITLSIPSHSLRSCMHDRTSLTLWTMSTTHRCRPSNFFTNPNYRLSIMISTTMYCHLLCSHGLGKYRLYDYHMMFGW